MSDHHGLPCDSSPTLCSRHRLSSEASGRPRLLPLFGSKVTAHYNLLCPSDAASSNKQNHYQE
jgi:hypothetical protein